MREADEMPMKMAPAHRANTNIWHHVAVQFRGWIGWIVLKYAFRIFHPSDPTRAALAAAIIAIAEDEAGRE